MQQAHDERAELKALGRGLLPRLPAQLLFLSSLCRAPGRRGSLLGPQLLRSLLEVLPDLRPLEVAPERRMRDAVIGSELPQRLARESS